MTETFSILINSTDSFEDCWFPFFTLFKKFWPDYKDKIYLNTELKTYVHEGLDIVSVRNCEKTKDTNITWSECLLRAVDLIDSDIILYMQDDYFIKDFVKNEIVESFYNLMNNHDDVDCIHLTDQSLISTIPSKNYPNLYETKISQRYRVSCQAALWRKSVLKKYIRTYENAWQFEEFGSQRAAILKHNFYVVDPNWVKLNQFEIIPYIFTGIVQGRWFEEVVPLFKDNKIYIDYSKRGFVADRKPKPIIKKIKYQFNKFPILVKHWKDIAKMLLKY